VLQVVVVPIDICRDPMLGQDRLDQLNNLGTTYQAGVTLKF
jgi:hypothetical protein